MGIFSSIKDAILGNDTKPDPRPRPAPTTGVGTETGTATRPAPTPAPVRADAPVAQSQAIDTVDIVNHLDSMPGADRLNWRTSIVDLLKLINVDSDYASRKALASELGREDYEGSAEDNRWLHKRTMRELAAHGGQVPPEYLD